MRVLIDKRVIYSLFRTPQMHTPSGPERQRMGNNGISVRDFDDYRVQRSGCLRRSWRCGVQDDSEPRPLGGASNVTIEVDERPKKLCCLVLHRPVRGLTLARQGGGGGANHTPPWPTSTCDRFNASQTEWEVVIAN